MSEHAQTLRNLPIVISDKIPPGVVLIAPPPPEAPPLMASESLWDEYNAEMAEWRRKIVAIINVGESDAVEPEAAQTFLRKVSRGQGQLSDVQDVPRRDQKTIVLDVDD